MPLQPRLARWRTAFDLYITGKKQGRSDLPHYDAVVDLRTSRGAYRIGIHYERLSKSNDEYARRIRAIERDDDVPLVLTIAATDHLQYQLLGKFVNVPKVFCVTEASLLSDPMAAGRAVPGRAGTSPGAARRAACAPAVARPLQEVLSGALAACVRRPPARKTGFEFFDLF